jgi:hypothetical protein
LEVELMDLATESNVLSEFLTNAEILGYKVLHTQNTFPDLVLLKGATPIRAEVERSASDFFRHGHDPKACDLIVCWDNDWVDSPLPVLELQTALEVARLEKPVALCTKIPAGVSASVRRMSVETGVPIQDIVAQALKGWLHGRAGVVDGSQLSGALAN